MKTMFNGCLLCEEVSSNRSKTQSGFETVNDSRFKKVKILASSEKDIHVGDIAQVRISAGERDPSGENNIVIHRGDVIYID